MSEKVYYLVNPSGTIHMVSRKHAERRLRTDPRFRMASAGEIEIFKETRVQRFDDPIARPWSPDPDAGAVDLQGGEVIARPDATDTALALAKANGVDLRKVEGTGAEGRILKADVEKTLEA